MGHESTGVCLPLIDADGSQISYRRKKLGFHRRQPEVTEKDANFTDGTNGTGIVTAHEGDEGGSRNLRITIYDFGLGAG